MTTYDNAQRLRCEVVVNIITVSPFRERQFCLDTPVLLETVGQKIFVSFSVDELWLLKEILSATCADTADNK